MRHPVSLSQSAISASLCLAIVASMADAAPASAAIAEPLHVECETGVCSALVQDSKVGIAPCAEAVILLAWRQSGGATLIQCETDDADMDKPSFIYNRDAPATPAFALTGMRFFASSALGELASGAVPDKFSSHALCQPPKPGHMAAGELLVGEKVPGDDEKNPYCYRVLRVATTPAGVVIRADDNKPPKPQARHTDWDSLAAKMTALIRTSANATSLPAQTTVVAASNTSTRTDVVHVVHAKAELFDSVGDGEAPHGYLVQGDEVTVLDRSKLSDGWLKVRYVGKSGKAIERWLDAADVGVKVPAATSH